VLEGPKEGKDDRRRPSDLSGETISQGWRELHSHEVGEEVRNPRREGDLCGGTSLSTHFEAPKAMGAGALGS
jgi:hypothetical protein